MTEVIPTGKEPSSFFRDVAWIGIAQVFTALTGLITLPILTKTYTTETYGIWTQVGVTVTLISPVANLHLENAVIRFLSGESDREKRRRITGAMMLAIIMFGSLIFVGLNLFAPQVSSFLFDSPSYTTLVRLTFLWIFVDAFYAFFIGVLRAYGMIKRIAAIQTAFVASKVAIIVVLTLTGFELQWIVVSNFCIESIFALSMFVMIVKQDGLPLPNISRMKEYLAFSLPQIPVGILAWIMGASDRYLITHFLDLAHTGIYATSNILAGLVSFFYGPIGFVLYPVVSKTWEENKKTETKHYFEYSTRIFLTLAVPTVVGIALLSQPLLKLLTTSEYLAGAGLVVLVGFSQLFAGIFSINEYIIYLVKQTRWLPFLTIVTAGISVALNWLLIPHFGIIGAAISKVIAYFVLAVIVTVWAKKVINYNINFKYIAKNIVASLIMALGLYFFKVNNILDIVLAVFMGTTIYIVMLFVLRVISNEEKKRILQMLSKVIPWRH